MKVLAVAMLAAGLLSACERESVRTAFPEPVDIKINADGKITVNGEVIPLDQLEARLERNGGSILVETDADGKSFVTVNDKRMTPAEYRDFVAAYTQGGASQ